MANNSPVVLEGFISLVTTVEEKVVLTVCIAVAEGSSRGSNPMEVTGSHVSKEGPKHVMASKT